MRQDRKIMAFLPRSDVGRDARGFMNVGMSNRELPDFGVAKTVESVILLVSRIETPVVAL